MGSVSSSQIDVLEIQTVAARPHPDLGFVLEMNIDLICDALKRDGSGQPKWRRTAANSKRLVLNSRCTLTAEEVAVHKLAFIYHVLKSEKQMRTFFAFMDEDARRRAAGEAADVLYSKCRDVAEKWLKELDTVWYRLTGLEEGSDSVLQWLKERSQPVVGSVPELYARFCALHSGSLTPLDRVFGWVQSSGLESGKCASEAVKLYAAGHMRREQPARGMRQGEVTDNDPFDYLHNNLLQTSNKWYFDSRVRRLLLFPEELGTFNTDRWCAPGRLPLFRSRNMPRSALHDLLRNAGLGFLLSERLPTRVLDLLLRELTCEEAFPTTMWLCRGVTWPSALASISDIESRLQALRSQVADSFAWSREACCAAVFQETKSDMEYVDKLLEYGCCWVLDRLSDEQAKCVAQNAGCGTRDELMARLDECLSCEYLRSWLIDHSHVPQPDSPWVVPTLNQVDVVCGSRLELLEKYRDICRCYFGERPECADLREEVGLNYFFLPVPAMKADEAFKRALLLFTSEFQLNNEKEHDRLKEMARLLQLEVPEQKGDAASLAQQVAAAMLARLHDKSAAAQLDELLDRFIQQEVRQGLQTPSSKLHALWRFNQKCFQKFSDLEELTKLLGDKRDVQAVLRDLGLETRSKEQDAKVLSELLETYTNRDLLLKAARLHRPVASSTSTFDMLM